MNTLTAAEKDLINGVRRQCDAKAAAQLLAPGQEIRTKQHRGRVYLLFPGSPEAPIRGDTWREAILKLWARRST